MLNEAILDKPLTSSHKVMVSVAILHFSSAKLNPFTINQGADIANMVGVSVSLLEPANAFNCNLFNTHVPCFLRKLQGDLLAVDGESCSFGLIAHFLYPCAY
ncbi:hypothetical protein D3C86_1750320 [compost metagenome]